MLEEVTQGPRVVGAEGGPLILEVGCGSGAISLSLLSRLPQVFIRARYAQSSFSAASVSLLRLSEQ